MFQSKIHKAGCEAKEFPALQGLVYASAVAGPQNDGAEHVRFIQVCSQLREAALGSLPVAFKPTRDRGLESRCWI